MPGGGVVHAPVPWLADFVELPDSLPATDLADALVRVGLEVERVEAGGALSGPLVIGRVQAFADEPQHVIEDRHLIRAHDQRERALVSALSLPQDSEVRLWQ